VSREQPLSSAAAGLRGRVSPISPRCAALIVSALLHVGAAFLLLRTVRAGGRHESAQSQLADDVDVALINPSPRSHVASASTGSTSAAPRRVSRPPSHSTTVGQTHASPDPAPPRAATTASKDVSPLQPPSGAADRAPDLSFDGLPDARKVRIEGLPNPQEDLERLLVPPPPATGPRHALHEVLAETERQEDAVENVRRGRAHPSHFDYLRDARDLLMVEASRLGEQFPLGAAQAVAGWGRGYVDRIAEISRQAAADGPRSSVERGVDGRSDILNAYDEAQTQAEAGAVRRAAYVCLGVAPRHAVVVTLGRSSGNERLDRLSLESFRSAATLRPVADDVRPGLACYAVRVSAYRTPPLPTLNLGWSKGGPTLRYPLKRIVNVSVELASVDYGSPPGPANLLRRAR
jgi:hypothetical protein